MHIEAVKDWLTVVATGFVIGGTLFGVTWKFVVQPHLRLYILDPIADMQRELHANGGTSLRDRVDDTQRTAANAVQSSADNGHLLAQHIEEANGDRSVLNSLVSKVNELNNEMVRRNRRAT